MVDRSVVLEALSSLCNSTVTSVQNSPRPSVSSPGLSALDGDGEQPLSIKDLVPTVLEADETSHISRSCFASLKITLEGGEPIPGLTWEDTPTDKTYVIDEAEFFAPEFDFDFTNKKDRKSFERGGEVYERPCGWYRFGLKVLDKYDGNAWLGSQVRNGPESVPGEWPVSYHGTSMKGAGAIIQGFYKPGGGEVHGRGIYSTPCIIEAEKYAKTVPSSKAGVDYLVILQNRVNPEFRVKHNNDKYWLVSIPDGISRRQEQEMVERSIRPYAILVKEAKPRNPQKKKNCHVV